MNFVFDDLTQDNIKNLIGVGDENIIFLEELYDCGIVYRDNSFKLLSDDRLLNDKFAKHLEIIVKASKKQVITIEFLRESFLNLDENLFDYSDKTIAYTLNGKPLKCKTYKQYLFYNALNDNDVVFAIGPAGTGKTFLAVLQAINAFKRNEVKKIIITRPAVEAGESLGFLPGDLKEKIDPYLMPIYDVLDEILGKENKDKYIEKGIIEIIPLAYMRGRTLNDAFVILDEAQNTSDKQMLMFLTRLGYNSKMIINGDTSQIDLNLSRNRCGLIIAKEKLMNINRIAFIEFDKNDVVRNPLVSKIIERFTL